MICTPHNDNRPLSTDEVCGFLADLSSSLRESNPALADALREIRIRLRAQEAFQIIEDAARRVG